MAPTQAKWQALFNVCDKWFYAPDRLVIRAAMACAAALDLDLPPAWLTLVGVPSTGKTELYLQTAMARPHVVTGDISIPGLISMHQSNRGQGLLARMGVRGLWVIKDFGSILGLREERRNELLGAMREIWDGRWERTMAGKAECWTGTVNVLAAATPAIERFHRINAELGDRFLVVRVPRPSGEGLWRKAARQVGRRAQIRVELEEASRAILLTQHKLPAFDDAWNERLYAAAEVVALGRRPVEHDFRMDIVDVGPAEASARVFRGLQAITLSDAALHAQEATGTPQIALLQRIAFDCLPIHRGHVIRTLATAEVPIPRQTLFELTGETWENTFDRTLSDLVAIGAVERRQDGREVAYQLRGEFGQFVQKLVHPQEGEPPLIQE